MEIIGLVVIVLGAMAYYGVFGSVETAARMGNRKMARLEAEQIKADINYYASKEMPTDADYKKAVASKELFNKFRDL